MVYEDFKDLPRRTTSDTVLYDKALNVANMMGIKEVLPQKFTYFLMKSLLLRMQINLLVTEEKELTLKTNN